MSRASPVIASAKAPRCALYAGYSSDNQREASIEDQPRICQVRAEREGWSVVATPTDAAISVHHLRPGYQALLAAMRAGQVDIVLAESLDRFSRDPSVAAFHKQARFCRVQTSRSPRVRSRKWRLGSRAPWARCICAISPPRRIAAWLAAFGRAGRWCTAWLPRCGASADGEPERVCARSILIRRAWCVGSLRTAPEPPVGDRPRPEQ